MMQVGGMWMLLKATLLHCSENKNVAGGQTPPDANVQWVAAGPV